jgi:hypothetical protein
MAGPSAARCPGGGAARSIPAIGAFQSPVILEPPCNARAKVSQAPEAAALNLELRALSEWLLLRWKFSKLVTNARTIE